MRTRVLACLTVGCLAVSGALIAAGCDSSVETEGRGDGDGETSQAAFCARSCEVAADCCAEGVPDCPGAYPKNHACDGGLCRAPRCESNADCTVRGQTSCRMHGGLPSCVRDCTTDADCDDGDVSAGGLGSPTVCSQAADDGTKICGLPRPFCDDDSDCLVPGTHCLDGERCGCRDDDDCVDAPFKTCLGGACSCASDAECGPNLDVCTTDRAFDFPSGAALPGTGGTSSGPAPEG